MNPESGELNYAFGLLACGSAGRWRVDLDESYDGTRWSLQLDGPQIYLDFALKDLRVIGQALEYLRAGQPRADALHLGQFDSSGVSFHWDNEDAPRCFLIVSGAGSVMHVTLSVEDTSMIAGALEQVLGDLPPEARGV